MSITEIIECSAYQSKQKFTNAEWITNLQKPLVLNPGDSITVRQSIIDANLSGEYENIALLNDVDIDITFGYWYLNDGIDLNYGVGNPLSADANGYYVARSNVLPGNQLLTGDKKFTIPKGNYSPTQLAEIISSKISILPQYKTISQYDGMTDEILSTVGFNNYQLNCSPFSLPDGNSYFDLITVSNTPLDPIYETIYAITTPIKLVFKFNGNNIPGDEFFSTMTSININTGQIYFAPPFTYDPNIGEVFITDLSIQLRTPSTVKLYSSTGATGLANDYITFTAPRYIGSSQFALEYNINGSGLFQITIMHTPYYTTNTDSDQAVSIYQYATQTTDLYFGAARTGIFFTKLEPSNFWSDVLGFDLDNILVVDGLPNLGILSTPLISGKNITTGYLGLDTLIGSTRLLASVPVVPYFYKTNITNPISAIKSYQAEDAGYFLVELQAIPSSYSSEVKPMSGILQIASNNWDSSGFITVYNDSSLIFTNNTNDLLMFGSFRIRILSPINYLPLQALGPKSTIFLERIPSQPLPISKK